jgi:hypothetical protein
MQHFIEVEDYKGRIVRLLKHRMRKPFGTRYVTRNSVAKVIRGEARRVRGGSDHPKAPSGWRARASNTRMRIGCHAFTGVNFRIIKDWALTA